LLVEPKPSDPNYDIQPEPSVKPAAKAGGGYSEAPAPVAHRPSTNDEKEKILQAALQSLDAAQLRHLVGLLSKHDQKTWEHAKFFADKAKELKEKFDKKGTSHRCFLWYRIECLSIFYYL